MLIMSKASEHQRAIAWAGYAGASNLYDYDNIIIGLFWLLLTKFEESLNDIWAYRYAIGVLDQGTGKLRYAEVQAGQIVRVEPQARCIQYGATGEGASESALDRDKQLALNRRFDSRSILSCPRLLCHGEAHIHMSKVALLQQFLPCSDILRMQARGCIWKHKKETTAQAERQCTGRHLDRALNLKPPC